MNLRDLHYIVTVAQLKHFSQAAEVCHISQPSLSMQIRKVEEELGITLFERSNKQVLVTSAGQQFVTIATRMLALEADLRQLAAQQKNPLAGVLRIGIIPTIAPYLLPKLLPALAKVAPQLQLHVQESQTHVLLKELREGTLECAILALPIRDANLTEVPLYDEPFLAMVPADHSLAKKTSLHPVDLQDESLLLLEDGHCLRDQALEVCQLGGAVAAGNFRGSSLETIRNMVTAHYGITLMPALAVPAKAPSGVKYIPFHAPAPHRAVGLVHRTSYPRQAVVKLVQQVLDSNTIFG